MRFLFLIFVFFVFSCDKKVTPTATTTLNVDTNVTTTTSADTTPTGIFFAGEMSLSHVGGFEEFLELCRYCGSKRLHANGYFQRVWTLSGIHECDAWTAPPYFQIEFAENALPSSATVWIVPSNGPDSYASSIKFVGQAEPRNDNEGFEINLSSDIAGQLFVKSSNTNHVTKDKLSVEIHFGRSGQTRVARGTSIFRRSATSLTDLLREKAACQYY